MTSHRKAREATLQVLFQKGFQSDSSPLELFNSFADNFEFDSTTREYALIITQGVLNNEEQINKTISEHSENWKFERIAVIDRILLQIAIFELVVMDNCPTPPKLTITDIIDLAKKYSSEDSKKFINGILDQIYNQQG